MAREVSALLACMAELKVRDGWIVNLDMDGSQMHKGMKLTFVPLWKFLLFGLGPGLI